MGPGDRSIGGHYRPPQATAQVFVADGWIRTGDIERMDVDGDVFIVDRAKDMINVGGEKVYPCDVEEVLFRHPAVTDAVVLAASESLLGEVPRAVVVLSSEITVSAEELLAFLRPALATFKLPRWIEFVTAVPRKKGIHRIILGFRRGPGGL